MKPARLILGLTCAVLASGALGKTESAKKSPQKPVVARHSHAKAAKPVKPGKAAKPTKPTKRVVKPKKAPVVAEKQPKPAPKLPAMTDKFLPKVIETPKDNRELVNMPSPARLALRAEMRDRMAALDSVLQLMNAGKTKQAGEIAQNRLGVAVRGNHRRLPSAAQPEPYMAAEMQSMAFEGYKAASDFATVALTGDQATATALLPQLTGSCAQCHKAYRIR